MGIRNSCSISTGHVTIVVVVVITRTAGGRLTGLVPIVVVHRTASVVAALWRVDQVHGVRFLTLVLSQDVLQHNRILQ